MRWSSPPAAPPYTDWPAHYPKMMAGVVEGAAAAGARLVTAENVYVYGALTSPLTEETPWNPNSKKGELRARLNQELLDAHRAGKVKVALGRGPDYFGPRATTNTLYGEQVFKPARSGKPANVFGDLDTLHTWIYVEDFAAGLVAPGQGDAAMGQVWHLPCPAPLTQRALLTEIYRQAGHPMRARALPRVVLGVLGWFVPIMRELGEVEYQWRTAYDFRHDKFDAAFPGAVAVTPHPQAIAATLAWYQENVP
jgi:nucleoside-diphosphate-sugar epimerase